MYKEKIIDTVTGEITWRDYTDEEIAEVEKAQAEVKAKSEAQAEAIARRQVILDKLGITAEEAKLLLL